MISYPKFGTLLAVVPGEQEETTHNQKNRFQTGLTLALTLRTAVIYMTIIQAYWPIFNFITGRILHALIINATTGLA